MRALPLVVLSVLVVLPLAAQDSLTVAPGQAVLVGVRYPENVGAFAASRITRYPDPELGMSVSYLAQGLRAEISIYVYPVPADASGDALRGQFDADWQVMQRYAEQARDMEVTVEGEGAVEVTADDGTPFAGFKGEVVMRRQGQASASFLYLFRKGDAFIKYRVSYDRSLRLTVEPEVPRFISATLAGVIPASRAGAAQPDGD